MPQIRPSGKRPLLLLAIALSTAEVMANDTTHAAATQPQSLSHPEQGATQPIARANSQDHRVLSRQNTGVEATQQVLWSSLPKTPSRIISTLADLPAMALNSRGDGVYQLQAMLQRHGFQTPMHGIFDALTYRQLVLFQGSKNLEANGIVDAPTLRALEASAQPSPTPKRELQLSTKILRRGSRGPLVEQVQRRLVYQGFTLKIDGVFGLGTHRAVRQFQQTQGLRPDGIVGTATARALRAVKPL